jgi:hypothetical protein
MKKEYVTKIFKVKHADGVIFKGNFFTYVGRSRVDGLPLYSCTIQVGECVDWKFHFKDFIFNCRPGYTPGYDDFELMPSQDWMPQSIGLDLVSVQPMEFPEPTGILYYLDYVYDDTDERLLLMM